MTGFEVLQGQVGKWGQQTFPTSTLNSIRLHFAEEAGELDTAITAFFHGNTNIDNRANIEEEAADCILILMHLAHRMGFSLERAVRAKFAEVQTRKWDDGADRGYSKRIPDAAERAVNEAGA